MPHAPVHALREQAPPRAPRRRDAHLRQRPRRGPGRRAAGGQGLQIRLHSKTLIFFERTSFDTLDGVDDTSALHALYYSYGFYDNTFLFCPPFQAQLTSFDSTSKVEKCFSSYPLPGPPALPRRRRARAERGAARRGDLRGRRGAPQDRPREESEFGNY